MNCATKRSGEESKCDRRPALGVGTFVVGQGRRVRPCGGLTPKQQQDQATAKTGKQLEAGKMTTDDDQKAPLFPSSRLLIGVMNCLSLLFLYLLRLNLSLSMVCMVRKPLPGNDSFYLQLPSNDSGYAQLNDTSPFLQEFVADGKAVNPQHSVNGVNVTPFPYVGSTTGQSVVHDDYYNTSSHHVNEKGEFEWNRQFQGYILSSYFYGYLVTQVLGGFLSGRYGAKHVLGTGMIIQVVMTMLTPVAARLNAYVFICLRMILGAAGGVFFPSVQSLWGPWAPPFERSFLVSLTFFGITFGNIFALGLSSQFCALSLDNGWPLVFYTTGAAGFVFWLAWNYCVYSSPNQHPRITDQEKLYIQKCIGSKGNSKKLERRPPVPWLKILTSPAVWAILMAQTANTWFTHTSITLPFYMKDVLKFDVKQNGLFLILPYIIDIIVTPFISRLADYLRIRKILSTVALRKIYQSTSCVVCSILLITLSFMDYERRYVAVGLLCLIYPFQNLYRSGYAVNLQDIAPKFAGEIFGITNTAGTVCGIVSPVIVGALTTHGTKHEWQTVFFISAGFFLFGGLIFAIFARGEIQPWAEPIRPQELIISEVVPGENGNNNLLKENGQPDYFKNAPSYGDVNREQVILNPDEFVKRKLSEDLEAGNGEPLLPSVDNRQCNASDRV